MKTCNTCSKWHKRKRQCLVLKEIIEEDCWAWSDDKFWFKKVMDDTEKYRKGKFQCGI